MQNENEHSPNSATQKLEISDEISYYLSEIGKWANFLAILGFIAIGLMVLGGLFASTIFTMFSGKAGPDLMGFPSYTIGIVYIVFAILYFFPVNYLYNFSVNIKKALLANDSTLLNRAFVNLKSHYKYIGIMTIIVISIYILMVLIMFITAGSLFR